MGEEQRVSHRVRPNRAAAPRASEYGPVPDFLEVADRVWVARYDWFDVNITLIGSDRGLVVVDTHGSTRAGTEVVDDVRRLGAGEVTTVVNTHWHFDHTFGNAAFRAAYGPVPIHAHENALAELGQLGDSVKQRYAGSDDLHRADVLATELALPDETFSSARVLDLGDRLVELVYPGRGHTSGDLVVRVPDVDVVLSGDLVEESAAPSFGSDSWPMDWPLSLDVVIGLVTTSTVVVPGHGAPVDRDFVEIQRNDIGVLAETIRDLATRGVPVGQALAAAEWPFPPGALETAVRRGYEQLPRSQKRLPLI
jgi:glyoxylase-like metal-dependent hydrolase (beta-lactamase superfamily II)